MKRLAVYLLALAMLLGALAGCAGSTTPSNTSSGSAGSTTLSNTSPGSDKPTEEALKGKIVFATTRNDRADTTIKALADEFMALHSGTTIEIEVIGDLEQEMRVKMAANEIPDVSTIIGAVTAAELTTYYEPLDVLGFTKDNMLFYNMCVGSDGKLYALNESISYIGIVYNKKVFRDAGITKIPRTLDDFWDACAKIKALGVVPIASNFKDQWPLSNYAQGNSGVVSKNGNYLNELVGKDVVLEENGMLPGLRFLAELYERGYLEPDLMSTNWEGSKGDIAAGRVAMTNLNSSYPPQYIENGAVPEDLGMMPLPYADAIVLNGGWRWGVAKNSDNKPLAKAFLKYLWDDGRYAGAIDMIPAVVGVESKNRWVDELLSFGLELVEKKPNSDEFKTVVTKSEYDFNALMAQEYVLAKDRDAFVKSVNKKWADAQK